MKNLMVALFLALAIPADSRIPATPAPPPAFRLEIKERVEFGDLRCVRDDQQILVGPTFADDDPIRRPRQLLELLHRLFGLSLGDLHAIGADLRLRLSPRRSRQDQDEQNDSHQILHVQTPFKIKLKYFHPIFGSWTSFWNHKEHKDTQRENLCVPLRSLWFHNFAPIELPNLGEIYI